MKHLSRLAISFTLGLAALSACAQEYPNRPVHIIVGYLTGGGPDIQARLVAQSLSQILKQPFVVDNKPGAAGTLATGVAAKMAPDGYNLLLGETGQMVIAPFAYKSLPYDSLKDFAPIGMFSSSPLVLVASRKTTPEIRTMQDLIREAKARPGKLDYGTPGVGGLHHIVMESLKADLGIRVTHIPYRGVALSVPAVLSGEVPLIVTAIGTLRSNAAQLHILAISSKERFPGLPDVPAMSEFVKDFEFASEMGLLGPAGTPQEVIGKVSAALKTAVQAPEFIERERGLGFATGWTSPEGYADNLRKNLKRYERAVRIAGIQPE